MRNAALGMATIAAVCFSSPRVFADDMQGLAVLGLEPPPPPGSAWVTPPGGFGGGAGFGPGPAPGYGTAPDDPAEALPDAVPAQWLGRRARRAAHQLARDAFPPAPAASHRWGYGAAGARGGVEHSGARPVEVAAPQPAPAAPRQNSAALSVLPQQAPPSAAPTDPDPAPQGAQGSQFVKQEVAYSGPEAPGTIVIDTQAHFLFLVGQKGQALRYGVGVGRPGFEWAGVHTVTRKAEWPEWIPPDDMLKRRPDLPTRLPGGPHNPLGARALYLGSTLYRIHGTNDPSTIGENVSSGCIRMTNDDVIDLYNRVAVGTKVVVR